MGVATKVFEEVEEAVEQVVAEIKEEVVDAFNAVEEILGIK